jgi:predicted nucleic acid-binding protein
VITAVDSNVLIDVLQADPTFGPRSREALRKASAEGGLVACDVVWGEVAAWFPTPAAAEEAMGRLRVTFGPLDISASTAAGAAWRVYRSRGGKRTRLVSDFLIGAHAWLHADRLLSRDRGFYRNYFGRLRVLDPSRDG